MIENDSGFNFNPVHTTHEFIICVILHCLQVVQDQVKTGMETANLYN